ncbi:MAG: BON domain-containing protein [Holosporaceae bacterium]|jgi:osmotically-inducible protein OsmY|nr:BON domain-containing protein [Holosporaceae bacterium]
MKAVYLFTLSSLLLCSACDPLTVAVGGATVVGVTSVRNREGVSGSISDSSLQVKIDHALLDKDKDLFDRTELCVKHGMVVVIGYMKDERQRNEVLRTVRSVEGYKEIFDETKVQEKPKVADLAADSVITSRIKSSLLFDGNLASLNYDVTTVKGIVYICGTAQSQYERDVVLHHARTTSGVNKVIAYIKIKDEKE